MKVGIIGCGATGLLMASFLGRVHNVTLYARRLEQVEDLNKNGFVLETSAGSKVFHIPAKHINELEEEELAIICVKQPDVQPLLANLKNHPAMPILFLQNGMGHERLAASLPNPVLIGVNEHGVRLVSPNRIRYGGSGNIIIGPLQGDHDLLVKISEALDSQEHPFVLSDNIIYFQKMKLLVNAVINPITTLFRVNNGRIIDNTHLRELALKTSNEASFALGIDQEAAWQQCLLIAGRTAENRSSMLQDMEAGRRTEIDSILGYIIDVSDKELVTIDFLIKCIKALETIHVQGEDE
ncbi:2-dehydropantoate 2-reductase [Aciduricibacillus chroicocephali]|uniref:2-dehydropantoate 2-reductase n=1 Tax=Aciduricibacillus chroicocephali TaxID=3054939 RepID=A0ABY9KY21_9BACI|nr:2-dehydropantoate 2-reductase [Bacillaceae bacterium 44XB]